MSALRNVGTEKLNEDMEKLNEGEEKSNVGMDREIEQTYHELTN